MQPAMLLSNLSTLLLPLFLLLLLLLTPFSTHATPQDDPFYTATTRQGRQFKVGVLPGYHLPTDGNGQIINDYKCRSPWDVETGEIFFKRQHMLLAVDGFCAKAHGKILPDVTSGKMKTEGKTLAYSSITLGSALIIARIEVAEGVVWKVDGKVCNELLRWLVDDCDTHGEDVKDGGTVAIAGVTFSLEGEGLEKEVL